MFEPNFFPVRKLLPADPESARKPSVARICWSKSAGKKAVKETKFAGAALSTVGVDGMFEGYASLFGVSDLGGDVVIAGAFKESLAKRGPLGVKMLWSHDPALPIGVWNILNEDPRGLYVRGQLDLSVAKARETHALLRSGAIDGLSIGFKTVRSRRDAKTGGRRLEKVDLWEVSIVTFPMLPQARVSAVKRAHPVRMAPVPPDAENRALARAIRRATAAFY